MALITKWHHIPQYCDYILGENDCLIANALSVPIGRHIAGRWPNHSLAICHPTISAYPYPLLALESRHDRAV